MIYKQVSAGTVIARVYDSFNIDYSDFEVRAIEWIGQALGKMDMRTALTPCFKEETVVSFRAKLPCTLKILENISYEGSELPREDRINKYDTDTEEDRIIYENTYSLDNNGYIRTTFETGTIRFNFHKIPTEYDCTLNIEVPLVPDIEEVLTALEWYVLYKMMARGKTHPVFTIGHPNPELCPSKQFKIWSFKAKNKAGRLDLSQRNTMREHWTALVSNFDATTNTFFDNTEAVK